MHLINNHAKHLGYGLDNVTEKGAQVVQTEESQGANFPRAWLCPILREDVAL